VQEPGEDYLPADFWRYIVTVPFPINHSLGGAHPEAHFERGLLCWRLFYSLFSSLFFLEFLGVLVPSQRRSGHGKPLKMSFGEEGARVPRLSASPACGYLLHRSQTRYELLAYEPSMFAALVSKQTVRERIPGPFLFSVTKALLGGN
jgi:hypothetical protein